MRRYTMSGQHRRQSFAGLWLAWGLGTVACGCHGQGHHHDHAGGHDHGGAAEQAEDEGPSLAITRWSERYELFVELPVPVPGKPVPYHAHVTRLSDFLAVTEGTFKVRYKPAVGDVQEFVQVGVKRPGIFVFESPAPAAGVYALEMAYEHADQVDVFDCGKVTVAEQPASAEEEPSGAAITFLKESQWKVPFGTAWAEEQPLAKEMEVAATVEPAAKDQLTVGAPTGGRFFHNSKLALAEGMALKKGDLLGTIAPTVAGDDYTRLQFAVEEGRLAKEQTQREVERVQPLIEQNLLPERRLIELQNELETQSARLASARARLGRVVSPGGEGGLMIKSNLDGIISQVLVPNGEPVEAGAALVRIGGTEQLWLRARFVAKPTSFFVAAAPTAVRLSSGERIDLEGLGAQFLSPLPAVDQNSRIATWIVEVPPASEQKLSPPAGFSELRPGASVVLTVRFGSPAALLAVPREAVVEINTRPYVFVQLDGEHFEKRAVTLGQTDKGLVHVVSGIKPGERIVTRGGFDIHLASLLGTIESHRH
jgi:membrane fusion protein, heavy metal efflux system